MKLNKNFKLSATAELSQIISSQIAKVKIYVMYAGRNRNHTHFSKEMIEEKLIPTMYGMPIIGEFIPEGEDFGDHGGKVTIKGDEVRYESTTVPYGFIPESSKIEWEEVVEKNGQKREYLVCDAYVWYKRYPEVERILDEPRNQSMEIEIENAQWDEKLGAYDILEAEFAGACILGKNVEPCFESARIGKFSLEKMKFDLGEMAKELKEVIKDSEVNTEMENEKELEVVKTSEQEVIEAAEVVETQEEVVETPQEEQPTEEYAEVAEEVTEEVTEEETEEENSEETQVEEKVQELAQEVETVIENAPEGTDETAIQNAQAAVEEVEAAVSELVEATENVEETKEDAEETETNEESLFQAQDFEALKSENEELKNQVAAMETELAEYRAFKKEQELSSKKEIIESFASELSEEELAPVQEKLEDMSNEEIETQLFALLGKKKMNYSATPKADSNKAIVLSSFSHEDDNLPSWARAIEKTLRK